ncbi:MAG: DsrE family protein [Betaproteobacteria bacterium]|nr:DsrE family protein [Betaproteobacteria bacterium]
MALRQKLALMTSAAAIAVMMSHSVFAADAPTAAEAKSEYVQPKIHHESFGQMNIVVPLTTDDKGVQGKKLRNIANGLKAVETWKGDMHVVVVIYAKGITLLKNPEEKVQKQLDALRAKGVKFAVCDNTLREQGLDFHKLYNVSEADIVPSGFAEVAYLQAHKHFVADPTN